MFSAPRIRKQILLVLNDHIIPALQTQIVPGTLLGPPFHFSDIEHRVIRQQPLDPRDIRPLEVVVRWEENFLIARRMSQLCFLYRGSSEERVGLRHEIANEMRQQGLPLPAGVTAVRLSAPAVFYVPSNVPHSDNAPKEFLSEEKNAACMLIIQSNGRDLFVRHLDTHEGATHSIHVINPLLNRMREEYLTQFQTNEKTAAQNTLLQFFTQLAAHLEKHPATISNTSWPTFYAQFVQNNPSPQIKERLCFQAIDYIQFHLHTPLTSQSIARECGVSYVYLNRIFHEVTGRSLMRFVTESRLNAAQNMLTMTQERIGDIAVIVGFAHLHSFTTVFKRHTGMSPREYRDKYRQ